MLNETRVNLQHLLEDIRDSYSSPIEEVIITELIANSLDSHTTRLDFFTDSAGGYIRCMDNGSGMRRAQLKEYHNIAATTKVRGSGIGFAGIGAKLSLLVADKVITESKGPHRSRTASEWHLTNPCRAPWKHIPISETITSPHGTAITIVLKNPNSQLLDPDFVTHTIVKHFYALLHPRIHGELLRFMYKHGVQFYVNGEAVVLPTTDVHSAHNWFRVHLGKARKPVGVGFIISLASQPSWFQKIINPDIGRPSIAPGLAISTYGKIIKTGWEWLGVIPKNHGELAGLVEIPAMAELLTTNKNDFLHDAASLKKYYRFRKAIQQAVVPILRSLGEERPTENLEPTKLIQPLTKQIEQTLGNLIEEFPELGSLIGAKRRTMSASFTDQDFADKETIVTNSVADPAEAVRKSGAEKQSAPPPRELDSEGVAQLRTKQPGLKIILEELEGSVSNPPLGRIVEDMVSINVNHSGWIKAQSRGLAEYHILVSVALMLSNFLEPERNAQDFVNKFILAWGKQDKNAQKLF